MADSKDTPFLSLEDLLAEQMLYLAIEEEPAMKDGWLQFKRDITPVAPGHISINTLRRRYDDAVQAGTMEKMRYGQHTYYRVATEEETQPEDNE